MAGLEGGRPRWLGKSLAAGAALCLALALGPLLRRPAAAPPLDLPQGPWTDVASLRTVAAYLNRQVQQPGFHAEVHMVKRGENLWSIAKAAGVGINSLVGCNPGLADLRARVGQALLTVNQRGALIQAGAGGDLESLAARLKVTPGSLERANRVSGSGLRTNAVLFAPGAQPGILGPSLARLFARRRLFCAPLRGRISSPFGPRVSPFDHKTREFHPGIDLAAPFNTPVAAAAAGRVILTGWVRGYGTTVILRHPHGYQTLYGHLNDILVKMGQRVRRRQLIGHVGMTGWSTGPHLIFDIRKNGKLVDPLDYLW